VRQVLAEQVLEDSFIILTQDAVKNLFLVAVEEMKIISNLKTNVKECVEATVCIDRN
jgi:hypothetical protein